jgi:hypothetical protein
MGLSASLTHRVTIRHMSRRTTLVTAEWVSAKYKGYQSLQPKSTFLVVVLLPTGARHGVAVAGDDQPLPGQELGGVGIETDGLVSCLDRVGDKSHAGVGQDDEDPPLMLRAIISHNPLWQAAG